MSIVGFRPIPTVDSTALLVDTADCQVTNGAIRGLILNGGTLPYNFIWTNSLGDTMSNGSSFDLLNIMSDNYTVTYYDAFGCGQQFGPVNVPINMGVFADFKPSTDSGQAPLPVTFTNMCVGADAYSWNFGDEGTSTVSDPKHLFKNEGTYTVTLIASKFTTCTDTATYVITVTEISNVIYPNIFTPNGDGVNDLFAFKTESLSEFECVIYNRWGEKIYLWNTVSGGWDGKTMSGTEASEGVYFFVMKAKGKDGKPYPNDSGTLQGHVTLTR
jgi:gliding motility-associated-like protein